jgi:hypothetical protein
MLGPMRETPIGIGQHRSNWAPRPRVRTHPEVFPAPCQPPGRALGQWAGSEFNRRHPTKLGQISTGVDNDASAAATAGSDWTSPGADRGAPQASQRHTNRPI